jgi:hypothetical protein
LRWTPYLEECLEILEKEKHAPTDLLLVHLVRVQLLCNAVVLVPWNQGSDAGYDIHLNAFKAQLRQLESSCPMELRSNGSFLQLNIRSTFAVLIEMQKS